MNIGTQVICIDDKFDDTLVSLIPNRPILDKVYTIRDTLLTRNGKAVHLEELINPSLVDNVTKFTFEPSFHVRRFRPILETSLEQTEYELSTIAI
jgi:hypothetical protein